jgi:hypothetical protein
VPGTISFEYSRRARTVSAHSWMAWIAVYDGESGRRLFERNKIRPPHICEYAKRPLSLLVSPPG